MVANLIVGPRVASAIPLQEEQGFFSKILSGLGNINLGDLTSTGLNTAAITELMGRLGGIGEGLSQGARQIGSEAQTASQFKPFTVTTGFGDVKTDETGGFQTQLTPAQQARQQALSGITGGLLGSYTGVGGPDVSDIQRQALGGVTGALTAAQAPMATREADVFERIRAVQRPEEERQRLALQEQLQSQGRTGLRTAMFGGSPEQFALEKARAEAQNTASLAAIQQAGAERQQNLGAAQGLFGLTGQAAGLPALLEASQLQNIGAGLGLEATPEQLLLSTLSPAINIASLADMGRRSGAGLQAEAGISGLEALAQTELGRASALRDLYGGILGAAGGSGNSSLFSQLFDDASVTDLINLIPGINI